MNNFLVTSGGLSFEISPSRTAELIDFGQKNYSTDIIVRERPKMKIYSFYDKKHELMYSVGRIDIGDK